MPCIHGANPRQCYTCELEEELDEARNLLRRVSGTPISMYDEELAAEIAAYCERYPTCD